MKIQKIAIMVLLTTTLFIISACGGGGGGGTTNLPPSISTQPTDQTMVAGNNASFSVTASGTGLTYQWQVDANSGTFINVSDTGVYTGSTTATLTLTGATFGMNGYKYRVVVSGLITPTATSNNATLSVTQAPSISTQPSNQTKVAGNNSFFSVTASGTSLTYQWQVDANSGTFADLSDSGVYSGSTSATLTLTGVTLAMNGYKYRVVVSGTVAPAASSNSATLTVTQAATATVKLATSGTLAPGDLIDGISTTVIYPINKGLSIANSDVVSSGGALGATTTPSTAILGQVGFTNIFNLTNTGFLVGEFATLTFGIALGNSPVATDFTIASGANVIVNSVIDPGLSVVIQSVTFQ